MKLLLALLLALPLALLSAESTPASFAYVLQADSLARSKPAAVARLAACGRDWIVLDAEFESGTPWEPTDLDAIRQGRPGRKVFAYISIGEAEEYRPYWRKEWGGHGKPGAHAPAWLGKENPDWKGNYRVKYWNPEWQKLMLTSVENAMSRGFDGVYLDIVDGFETFEQVGEDFVDDRENSETKQSYRRDMVDWVKAIAARARATNGSALVIPQNGSQLLAHPDFLATISGIGIEDLFTEGNKLQPRAHSAHVLGYLEKIKAAGKPVLLIEYPKNADRREQSRKLALENGLIWLGTDRELRTLGVSAE